jgi:hypothetical protein
MANMGYYGHKICTNATWLWLWLWKQILAKHRFPVLSVLTIFEDWSVVVPQYPEPFHQSAQSSSIASLSHTEPLVPHYTTLDTHDFVGTGESKYIRRNLRIHFVYVFFVCKSFDNRHTLFNSELHFSISVNVYRLKQRLTINATYYSDKIRPPDVGRLWAVMTHCAIGSYNSNLWERLCPLYAVARFPTTLNAV